MLEAVAGSLPAVVRHDGLQSLQRGASIRGPLFRRDGLLSNPSCICVFISRVEEVKSWAGGAERNGQWRRPPGKQIKRSIYFLHGRSWRRAVPGSPPPFLSIALGCRRLPRCPRRAPSCAFLPAPAAAHGARMKSFRFHFSNCSLFGRTYDGPCLTRCSY